MVALQCRFSSPLWGFFYLMAEWLDESTEEAEVLVPSLGILLFNKIDTFIKDDYE